MPTRKMEKRNIRSLTKIAGKSFGITFPIELIRKLGWRAKQKLTVTPKGKKLVVKDWKK
ncbi:MAG: AbrB/MazE/SpoVT family DNA-binding domain-containing protein [Candidatus Levybacteria bacterium]|nr:AbrB/MazE/SpoVT family DNA-binding domain-containing protein [Candidatus Levybacteria bacterium]